MTWKLYAVVSAGAFAATYLMTTPTGAPSERQVAPSRPSARQTANAVDIQELADRLHARVRAETAYRQPGRDPFRFSSRPAPAVDSRPPAFVPPPVSAPAPVQPLVALSGIATDTIDGVKQRSAVLSVPAGVLIVKEGESVAGLYRVVSIGDESIELEATADGSRRTLTLGR